MADIKLPSMRDIDVWFGIARNNHIPVSSKTIHILIDHIIMIADQIRAINILIHDGLSQQSICRMVMDFSPFRLP